MKSEKIIQNNVLGEPLTPCCQDHATGFSRDGYCQSHSQDPGKHLICAQMTEAFLEFSLSRNNNLTTPRPEWDFPGLKPGDKWCLCVERWREALEVDVAPPVYLQATHEDALNTIDFADLKRFAIDVH